MDMLRLRVWWRWLRKWRCIHLRVDRAAVLAHVDDQGALWPRYAFMALMSAGIAMLGLLQNSVAVIIGAMLISPLMGPIVAMGMALATFDFRALRTALVTLAAGVALALLIAVAIVAISPLQQPTPEILARTEPNLFDLLIAILSGLAGAYATITRKGETIVGVAIATALMPPLAVVAFGIAVGNAAIANGAAFLFMTNLLAIALSVTAMARWYGFAAGDSPHQAAWQATMIVGTFVLLSVPLGLALNHIAARGTTERTVRATLTDAAQQVGGHLTTLRVDDDGSALQVEAVVLVPRSDPRLSATVEHLLAEQLGRSATVHLQQVLIADAARLEHEQSTLAQLGDSVERLETAATRQAIERNVHRDALRAMRERALKHFGAIVELADDKTARWRLTAAAGLDLAASRALEADVNHGDGNPHVDVVPALQALPAIAFADNSSDLDATANAQLDDIAWALKRWEADAIAIEGHAGGNDKLAHARADAVADGLRKRGVAIAGVGIADQQTTRALVRSNGAAAGRSVMLHLAPRAPP